MLSCRVINNITHLDEISDNWDRLVRRSEFSDVFATSGFARAWWRAYGDGNTLRIILVEDEVGGLLLVAPFYFHNTDPYALHLIGDHKADYNNFVYEKNDYASPSFLFAWLLKQKFWRSIYMRSVPGEEGFLHHLPQSYNPSSRSISKFISGIDIRYPRVAIQWDELHPIITKEFIQQLPDINDDKKNRQRLRKLAEFGTLDYQHISEPRQIRELMPIFMNLHIDQWEAKGQRSLFSDEKNRNFYFNLLDDLNSENAVRMDVLLLGGELIAANFGFAWDGRVYYYKPCFCLKYSAYSPGKVLLEYIIRNANAIEMCEVDLLLGLEEYKNRYATSVRKTGSIVIYRSSIFWLYYKLKARKNNW